MNIYLNAKTLSDTNPKDYKQPKPAPTDIRPLPLWQSILLFAVPALTFVASYHGVRPWLMAQGISDFESLIVVITVPMSWLLAAALVVFHRVEGRPLNWRDFSARMRFPRLTLRAVLMGLGTFAAAMVAYGAFVQLEIALITGGWIPVPENLPPLINPLVSFSPGVLESFVGAPLQGNWDVPIAMLVMLFFNVVGEELWWRGIILPRQELAHGRWTWLIHGLLWTGFHIYKWWDLIALLPVTLILSYVSQRTQNNWPALIGHFLLNGLAVIWITLAVVG